MQLLGRWGPTVGRRNMRVLGVLFILLGLAVAAYAIRTAGPDGAVVADGRSAQASNPSAAPSDASVAYVTPTRPASTPPPPAAAREGAEAAKGDLVRELQRELTRLGCYGGEINGIWTLSTEQAMGALLQRVNARLPTAQPEPVHLALAQAQHVGICEKCPRGEEDKSDARCANRFAVAMRAAGDAPVPSPERMGAEAGKRWQMPRPRYAARGPTQGRMALGLGGSAIVAAAPGARRRSVDQGSRTQHRAGRRHRTLVAKPPRYLRPMRPMRYAYRRPWGGFFAALFAW